jgi:hypothetical protein
MEIKQKQRRVKADWTPSFAAVSAFFFISDV